MLVLVRHFYFRLLRQHTFASLIALTYYNNNKQPGRRRVCGVMVNRVVFLFF